MLQSALTAVGSTGIDLLCSLAILVSLASAALVYARRCRSPFVRVERDGGSPLLSRSAMNAGYWALQPVGAFLVRQGVSADAITLGSLALSMASAGFIVAGHLGVAALLGAISACGDALDGLVARATDTASEAGQLLDATVDRYDEFLLLGALAIHYRANAIWLALALLALLGSFAISYGSAKAEALRIAAPRGVMRRGERAVYLLGGLTLAPIAALPSVAGPWGVRPGDVPVLLALGLIGIAANASALQRLIVMRHRLRVRAGARTPTPNTWGLLGRHQIASVVATLVDFGVMIATVEVLHFEPAAATMLGATFGAAVNFALGRRWIFRSTVERVLPQAIRYAAVSGASLAFNAIGEYAAADRLGVPYIVARLGISLVVSVVWNFPMQRYFVFSVAEATDSVIRVPGEQLR